MTVTLSSLGGKTRFVVTLTSGTSWTVPTGVTAVNATLQGGGGGGGASRQTGSSNVYQSDGQPGLPGQLITTYVSGLTPGGTVTYAIGAGGSAASTGGTTTFTGATSALGGNGISSNTTGATGTSQAGPSNGGAGGEAGGTSASQNGGAGGAGQIIIEYWK